MDRARKIIALSLVAVFLVTVTVFAAVKGFSSKVTFNGTKGFAWMSWAGHTSQRGAYILDSKNKRIANFKVMKPQKVYKKNNTTYGYYSYRLNMSRFKAGKYKLVTYKPNILRFLLHTPVLLFCNIILQRLSGTITAT